MFDDWGDASLNPQIGDLISFMYLRQPRTGVVTARNGGRVCVEAERGATTTSKWVDLEDVTAIDATAAAIKEANKASKIASRQVEYLKLAAKVHDLAGGVSKLSYNKHKSFLFFPFPFFSFLFFSFGYPACRLSTSDLKTISNYQRRPSSVTSILFPAGDPVFSGSTAVVFS